MRNITVAINDQVYHDVRVWCAKRDTSVSAVVQRFLEDLPRLKQARQFPLPDAPPPRTLAPLLETLETVQPPAAPTRPPVSGMPPNCSRANALKAVLCQENRGYER
jgi:hypothetical protein